MRKRANKTVLKLTRMIVAVMGAGVIVLSLVLLVFHTIRSRYLPRELPPAELLEIFWNGPQQLNEECDSTAPLIDVINLQLETMFNRRADAILTGDPDPLAPLYDTNSKYGRWALDHEQRRVKYIKAWAEKRGIKITRAMSCLRAQRVEIKDNTAWISLTQNAYLDYVYADDCSECVNRFGIGTRHLVELAYKQGNWLIRRDWYTDPLDEDTLVPEVNPACLPGGMAKWRSRNDKEWMSSQGNDQSGRMTQAPPSGSKGAYNREAAVDYAMKYCGVSLDQNHAARYNPKYKDYTGNGGDCTNFVSQVLADKEAGGLPTDYVWYYSHSISGRGGSRAWVQAETFANYLQHSGRATQIARGLFHEVTAPTSDSPEGAIQRLREGDLIGYEEKGRIEHFAVVVGRDSHGYVLVNSHTADRCRVPWDLGWDQKTVFRLFRINE